MFKNEASRKNHSPNNSHPKILQSLTAKLKQVLLESKLELISLKTQGKDKRKDKVVVRN